LSSELTGEFITLARVVKTQGRHGEVATEIHTDVPDRFSQGMKLQALGKENSRRELELEDFWPHKEFLVLKFAGVDSMTQAEELIGSELQVPSSDRALLGQGWNFVSDLVGSVVFDHGREIGRLADVQFGAGEAPLLIVTNAEGKKFDVPFAEAYLEGVNVAQRQVRMKLPEGLLEVNAPMTPEEKQQQRQENLPNRRHKENRKHGKK
jgi:16S rRNA processing protein RimM